MEKIIKNSKESQKILIDNIREKIKPKKNTLLEVKNLNKTFISGKNIVKANRDISFSINKGEVVGLIGESGSGKTTIGRNIINLHTPESGSILLDGKEISGKKLNKNQKKHLYNNIQMIFQDPYSSLNEQKNIMAIVSESLKAKKLDIELYKSYTYNKKQVLFYFRNELREMYLKKFWAYRLFANKTALEHYKKIDKEFLKFVVDPNKTMTENFAAFQSIDFDIKEEANYKIITKLDDLIEFTIKNWKKKQKVVDKADFDHEDESRVRKLNIKLEKMKENFGKSKRIIELGKELDSLLVLRKELISHNTLIFKKIRDKNKSLIKQHKIKILDLKNNKAESTSLESYNHEKLKLELEKSKIFVINKAKSLNSLMPVELVFKELENIYSKITSVPSNKIKVERFITLETIDELFDEVLKKYNEKNGGNNYLEQLNVVINNLSNKLSVLSSKAKKTVKNEQRIKIKELSNIIKEEENKLKDEINVYKDESDSRITEMINKSETVIYDLDRQIKALRKRVDDAEKLILKDILEVENYGKDNFKNIEAARKHVKKLFRSEIINNNKLELEIKVNMKSLKIIQQLYGIVSKNNFVFGKRQLKNVFVRQEVFDTLVKVGLNKTASYRYPHEFSGGMRQRVGIARALISKPKLIIADEPIAALDLSIQAQIVNLLLDLKEKENISLLFIAHDLSMVEHNSDRIVIMHLGRIVEYGGVNEVFKTPLHPYTKNLMKSIPSFTDLSNDFEDNKFGKEYLANYVGFNKPNYQKISANHFVLATESQFKEWKK